MHCATHRAKGYMSKREGSAGSGTAGSKRTKLSQDSAPPSSFEEDLMDMEAIEQERAASQASQFEESMASQADDFAEWHHDGRVWFWRGLAASTSSEEARWGRPHACVGPAKTMWLSMDRWICIPIPRCRATQRLAVRPWGAGLSPLSFYGVTVSQFGSASRAWVLPYLWAGTPGFQRENVGMFRAACEHALAPVKKSERLSSACWVWSSCRTASLLGYQFGEKTDLLKVHVAMPTLIPPPKIVMEDGLDLPGMGRSMVYEANVPFTLRFMIDHEIAGRTGSR